MQFYKNLQDLTQQPPLELTDWLCHEGKLSGELERHCQILSVNLLHQQMGSIMPEEAAYLQCPEESMLVREVFLQGDSEPWCYARTLVPQITYQAYQQAFDTLGTQLLGETILYQEPTLKRSAFEFICLTEPDWLFQHIHQYHPIKAPRWGRRSLFWLQGLPLSLVEVFLV